MSTKMLCSLSCKLNNAAVRAADNVSGSISKCSLASMCLYKQKKAVHG